MKTRSDGDDAAELWLKKNDPEYAQTSKMWQRNRPKPPPSDALGQVYPERFMPKRDSREFGSPIDPQSALVIPPRREKGRTSIPQVVGDGNYITRRAANDEVDSSEE